jgi:multicomponent Na+:H+ antiporter subunit C
MIELVKGHFPYWMCFLLLSIGLYGILFKRNLLKKVVGLTIFQASIVLFFIILAYKDDRTVPIFREGPDSGLASSYINPLPHALMLTAIVVSVATVGVALALLIRVYEAYGTIDEPDLWKELKK